MSFKTRLDKIKEDEKLAGIMPDSQAASEAEALEKKAFKMICDARDDINDIGVFYFTTETRSAEAEIDQTYKDAITGTGSLAALHAACQRWKLAATSKPGSPDMAAL